MTTKATKKISSRKPRSRVKASSLRGLGANVPQAEMASQLFSVIPFVVKTGVICTVAYFIYRAYSNRFVALKYRADLDVANISEAEAQTRAAAIYASIGWFSNSFDTVANAITGLNYNGFVRLYNAFGHHTGTLLSGDLDLIEWCRNQFSESEVNQLRFIMNGAFF